MLKEFYDPFIEKVVQIDVDPEWYEALLSVVSYRFMGLPVIDSTTYKEELDRARRQAKTTT